VLYHMLVAWKVNSRGHIRRHKAESSGHPADINSGGSPQPSRAPSPTPSQKQRNDDEAVEKARIEEADFEATCDAGWSEGLDVASLHLFVDHAIGWI
jgi:hypothetical protein